MSSIINRTDIGQNASHRWGGWTWRRKAAVDRYGSLADDVAALAEDDPTLGESFDDGSIAAEVVYAALHEAAATVADVALRRTRLSWLTADHGRAAGARIADLMAAELGWDAARRDVEIQRFEAGLAPEGL